MAKQTHAFSFCVQKKIIAFYLIFSVFIASIFISCDNNGTDPKPHQVKFAIVKYDVKVIKKWLDDTTNKAFIFQFYTNEAKRPDTVWQALSYIIDSKGNYKNGNNPDTLRLDTKYNNDTTIFTGKIVVGNNGISAKKMRELILKDDETPKGEFLYFFPRINNQHRHVYYRVRLESNNKLTGDEEDTDPCPPRICYEDDK